MKSYWENSEGFIAKLEIIKISSNYWDFSSPLTFNICIYIWYNSFELGYKLQLLPFNDTIEQDAIGRGRECLEHLGYKEITQEQVIEKGFGDILK